MSGDGHEGRGTTRGGNSNGKGDFMFDPMRLIRYGLTGGAIVAVGVVAGEVMSPAPLEASGCPYEQCFAGAGGDGCSPDVLANQCDFLIETCATQQCSGGGGPPRKE